MTIENTQTQISFTNPEKDGGAMVRAIQEVHDLTLEIQSAQEAIKGAIDRGFEAYKAKVSEESKKGDYSAFIKKSVSEILDGKVTSDVEVLENILAQIDLVKKNIKK